MDTGQGQGNRLGSKVGRGYAVGGVNGTVVRGVGVKRVTCNPSLP